jgi:sugar phosphate isomerase/epimerase
VSALTVHDNTLHPDEDRAELADRDLRRAIRLAAQRVLDVIQRSDECWECVEI